LTETNNEKHKRNQTRLEHQTLFPLSQTRSHKSYYGNGSEPNPLTQSRLYSFRSPDRCYLRKNKNKIVLAILDLDVILIAELNNTKP